MRKYFFLFIICHVFVFKGKCQSIVNEKKLIDLLSNPSQPIRDSAATTIRNLIASGKNVIAPENIVEHDNVYWQEKMKEVKIGMPLEKAHKLLRWVDSLSEGGACSGQSCTSIFRLDNEFVAEIAYEANGKSEILWDSLFVQARSVYFGPPSKFSGIWVTYFVNGQKSDEINYNNGEYEGVLINYFSNGQICFQQHYSNHDANGEDRGFYQSGALSYTGNYVNGKQEGEWIHYYENGKIWVKDNYVHGELDGLSQYWYRNGKMQLESVYKKGKELRQRAWDEDGILEYDHPGTGQ